MTDDPAKRLDELDLDPITLPVFGSFEPIVRTGDLLHTMGHWPLDGDQPVTGRLGDDLDLDGGLRAARLAALALIGTLADELGDLSRVLCIASMLVTINATPEFGDHTAVADAASDLLIDVFGPPGRHARLAVGVASLPGNVALELTAVVEAPVETV